MIKILFATWQYSAVPLCPSSSDMVVKRGIADQFETHRLRRGGGNRQSGLSAGGAEAAEHGIDPSGSGHAR